MSIDALIGRMEALLGPLEETGDARRFSPGRLRSFNPRQPTPGPGARGLVRSYAALLAVVHH